MNLEAGSRLILIVLLLAPCLALADEAPPVPEWPESAFESGAPIPFDPLVRTGTLDNGLRWYVRENDEPRARAALRLVVNAGSVLEDEDQRGLAHFLEHMAFNGTANFEKQELVDYLESIGMKFGPEINAYTSFDETVYMLMVPTDDQEVLSKAFTVLADWSRRVSLDPDEVTKERGVVLEEWRLGRGAQQRVRDEQLPVLYHGSRYAERLPIGLPSVIETADRERLARFYEQWYRPDLMAVVAVGDFDAGAIVTAIQENFGGDWGPETPPERPVFEIPPHVDTKVSIVTDPELSNTTVGVVVKRPLEPVEDVADYRASLVQGLYEGMLNQRLRELTQKPDPPFVFGGVNSSRFGRTAESVSLFAVAEDGGIEGALEAVLVETKRVAQHGFTPGELQRQKADLLRSVRRQFEQRGSTESPAYAGTYVAHFLSERDAPGIAWRYEAVQRLLPTITLDEIHDVDLGADLLQPESRVITASVPENEGVPVPTEQALLAVFDRLGTIETEPYVDDVTDDPLLADEPQPGEVVATEYIGELDLTIWLLDNGQRVLVKPTDFQEDSFGFTAFSPGGRSQGTFELDRSLDFATTMVSAGGLGRFDAVELQKKLSGKRASASPYISTYDEGLTGGGSPEDLEIALQLAWLTLREPRLDMDAATALQQRYAALLRNRKADPNSVYTDSLRAILTHYHPWSLPLTAEQIEDLDFERGLEFYRERFADTGDMTWIFVGALDLGELQPLVEKYIGGLPADLTPDTWRDPGIARPRGPMHRVVRAGVDEKSRTTLTMAGELEWTRHNRIALSWLQEALSIRLREVIREEMSGTYGVQVSVSAERVPESEWTVRISFGADPERLDELVAEVEHVLREVRERGFEPATIEKVREQSIRAYEEGIRENDYWLGTLRTREWHGMDHREQLDSLDVLRSMSADDVAAAARWALPVEGILRVDMLPAGDESTVGTR